MPTSAVFDIAGNGAIRDAACRAGLVRPGDRWTPLDGGRSRNRLWKIDGPGRALVCKLHASGAPSPVFPNDAMAERRALAVLSGSGLAPGLVAQIETDAGACLLYEFLPGTPAGARPEHAGRTLRALHDIAAPQWLRSVPSSVSAILAQADGMLRALPRPWQRRLVRARPSAGSQTGRAVVPVFLHGDPVPNNFIAGKRIWLIDWQCPAVGHPVNDLAIYLSPAMQHLYGGGPLSAEDRRSFLLGYGDPDASGWLDEFGPACSWRIAVHCGWRAARGDSDYADAAALELSAL